ncbi:putative amidohydrolase YtcJ [Microbacterium trichothecenolyticum]|uniref:Amidohydrolase YtcJ n=1 Tax=Microbacterium trichothecenolyticum TaxID=69370 RepID=A0ABU0TX48_MICTR|nr:putative amidohydrolase YtcJ [Microbacterium trichothecenolyticum]
MGDGAWRGRLAPGSAADVAVLDTDPFAEGSAAPLTSRVLTTVVAGRVVFADAEVRPG